MNVAGRLEDVARAAEAVGAALDACDQIPEPCEDSLSRALIALEDVHRGLERTAVRNENGPQGWLARSNVGLIRRLAASLARTARSRPGDFREWMRFKVEQAASALDDCLRDLLSPSRRRNGPRSRRRASRNPWTESGWVEASAEVLWPDGSRELAWDLGVFDPTDPATLTMDEIEGRLLDAIREAIRSGFVREGEEVVTRIDGRSRRYMVVRKPSGGLDLRDRAELGPAPGLPSSGGYRRHWASSGSRRRLRRLRNERPARGPLEAALAAAKARLARVGDYERAILALEAEILEDATPFMGIRGACEEIQGLLPAGSRLSTVAGQAMRACGAPPRPMVPGEGVLPPSFAESLLDRSRRVEQLQALIDRAAAAAWREIASWLRDESDCRLALGEIGEGVAASAVAARIRDRLMSLEELGVDESEWYGAGPSGGTGVQR